MGKDDSVQSEESCFVFPVSLTILSSFKEIITMIHWDKVSNFFLSKSYYWCLSQPFKDLPGTKMDNCILLSLPARLGIINNA